MAVYIMVFLLGWVFGAAVLLYMVRHELTGAYQQGQFDALKKAVEVAKERGDVAMLVAPPWEALTIPMVRAQMAHQIEMDLRNELAQVR